MSSKIDLSTEYVRCRTFGHQWDDYVDTEMRRPEFGWRFSLRCMRCAAKRHDLLDQFGNVLQREYRYPEGYKTAEKIARPSYRVELWRRLRRRSTKEGAA